MDKKTKLAAIWALITLASSALIWGLTVAQSDHILPIFMGITTFLYGPVCAILYLREVKNGVFSIDDEESEGEDE